MSKSYRPRHSDHVPGTAPTLDLTRFKPIGWYTIGGWATTCPECGVPRGGTPGYYWHLIREDSDDEERVREIHGDRETE